MEEDAQHYGDIIDKKILIKYYGDARITGVCRSIDGYLNTVLEDADFFENPTAEATKLATCFVRGGSLRHIEILE